MRGARPAAHEAERVADADERRARVLDDGVEEPEERRLPRVGLLDALRELADAVVQAWVEVSRSAGSDVERETVARLVRYRVAAPDVVREDADLQAGRAERLGALEHGVDDRVVADVRPGVI